VMFLSTLTLAPFLAPRSLVPRAPLGLRLRGPRRHHCDSDSGEEPVAALVQMSVEVKDV
jgi:hypothetical protein